MRRWFQAFRNRTLLNPGFHRFASAFWPTRLIARRQARRLFNLVAGFTFSQTLAACIHLDLFETLRAGPLSIDALAKLTGLEREAVITLADAAAALDLLELYDQGTYTLGPLGAVILTNPAIPAMVRHHAAFYRDMADPISLLRGDNERTELNRFWPYAGDVSEADVDADTARRYSQLMSVSQPMIAEEVLHAYNFSQHQHLLDIGGGDGSFVRQIMAAHPGLKYAVFDRPAVADYASTRFAAEATTQPVDVIGGDFTQSELPPADLMTLIRIIHDHNDDVVLRLLRNIRRSLPTNGLLLIAEPLLDTPSGQEMASVYFRFYLLAMGSGKPRTYSQISDLLQSAGFQKPARIATRLPILTSVLVAKPTS